MYDILSTVTAVYLLDDNLRNTNGTFVLEIVKEKGKEIRSGKRNINGDQTVTGYHEDGIVLNCKVNGQERSNGKNNKCKDNRINQLTNKIHLEYNDTPPTSGNSRNSCEEIYHFQLSTKVALRGANRPFLFQAEAVSFPVCMITHTSQVGKCIGKLMWTNMKTTSCDVKMTALMNSINSYLRFKELIGLDKRQMKHFCTKIMPNTSTNLSYEAFNTCLIIPCAKRCTAWGWLYSTFCVLNLKPFKQLWNAGHIIGYSTKNEAQSILLDSEQFSDGREGNFLIRFVNRSIGEISVSVVRDDKVDHIDPSLLKNYVKVSKLY